MAKFSYPGKYNAVMGNQVSQPLSSLVLGGIEGVKQRLTSHLESHRIAALKEALKYGKEGLELVAEIVQNESGPVQRAAYDLLWAKASEKRKLKLREYFPWHSKVGMDYTKLRDLLAARKFLAADEETTRLMLKLISADKSCSRAIARYGCKETFLFFRRGYIIPQEIETFLHTELRTIDQLWLHYSSGRYGFSVQKRIWDEEDELKRFIDRVGWQKLYQGWRKTGEWLVYFQFPVFKLYAPEGYFPIVGSWGFGGFERWWWWVDREHLE